MTLCTVVQNIVHMLSQCKTLKTCMLVTCNTKQEHVGQSVWSATLVKACGRCQSRWMDFVILHATATSDRGHNGHFRKEIEILIFPTGLSLTCSLICAVYIYSATLRRSFSVVLSYLWYKLYNTYLMKTYTDVPSWFIHCYQNLRCYVRCGHANISLRVSSLR